MIKKYFFICSFALFVLSFVLPCFAINLDSVKVAFVKGDYKEAITEGEKVMAGAKGGKDLDELYYILGLCYLKDGNYLRAGDIFEIILGEFKQSKFRNEAKLGLGDSCFFRGDYEKAKKEYENLLHNKDAQKLQALVYERLSECALKTGDARSADDYRKMLNGNFPLNIEPKVDLSLSKYDGGYSVQVGSFSSSINARNLKQKLVDKGYSVFVEEGYSDGKMISRVKVGSFSTRQAAAAAERRLSRDGYSTKICP